MECSEAGPAIRGPASRPCRWSDSDGKRREGRTMTPWPSVPTRRRPYRAMQSRAVGRAMSSCCCSTASTATCSAVTAALSSRRRTSTGSLTSAGPLRVPCHRVAAVHAGAPRHLVRLARLPLAALGLHRGLGGAHHPTTPAGWRDDHAGVGPPASLRGGRRELPHRLQRVGLRARARGRPVAHVSRPELHRFAGVTGPWRRVVLAGPPGVGGGGGSSL